MTYNPQLAQRVHAALSGIPGVQEKKMFGGLCCLLRGNMACGVIGDGLIVRVGAEQHRACMERPHTRPFDYTGRPMSGWLVVDPPGWEAEADLEEWVQKGVEFALSLPPK